MLSLLQLAGPPPSSAATLRSGGAGEALASALALTAGAQTDSPAIATTTAARRVRLDIMQLPSRVRPLAPPSRHCDRSFVSVYSVNCGHRLAPTVVSRNCPAGQSVRRAAQVRRRERPGRGPSTPPPGRWSSSRLAEYEGGEKE